jgi:hypothetical protein
LVLIIELYYDARSTKSQEREVTASRTDIIIKNKKRENMHTDRFGNTCGQKCRAKEAEKELKYKSARIEIQ